MSITYISCLFAKESVHILDMYDNFRFSILLNLNHIPDFNYVRRNQNSLLWTSNRTSSCAEKMVR